MDISSNQNTNSQVKALQATKKTTNQTFDSSDSLLSQNNNQDKKNISLTASSNQQIIEATFNSTAADNPLLLLSRETIDNVIASLNEQFKDATIAIDDIQTAYDNGLDISPEATADRIVNLSTGFFAKFQEQNPKLSDQEAARSFVEIISGGIDRGFTEARKILDNLNVLQGDIAENIDKTYDLVQDGLKSFLNNSLKTEERIITDNKDFDS